MDRVHLPDHKSWISKEYFSIRQFVQKLKDLQILQNEYDSSKKPTTKRLSCLTNISSEEWLKSAKRCDFNRLEIDDDSDFRFQERGPIFRIPDTTQCHTLNAQRTHLNRLQVRTYQGKVLTTQKYRNRLYEVDSTVDTCSSHHEPMDEDDADSSVKQMTENEEAEATASSPSPDQQQPVALITVQLFAPIKDTSSADLRRLTSVKEFVVASNQKLTVLRDAFRCVCDLVSPMDCSHRPNISESLNRAEQYTSAFFFINDVFYNDMRQSTSFDYSE